ncbi:beta-glucosidase [Vibrio xiamenensis]|uniref:Beta-glucosidase n=1 Tax=Vibrio xiamenensis TaxID=861298 RepID=A0A1G8ES37_9VIBR|nr:glycoside hydrolase family 3 N-terminal domain-containing protein [Vibrio xiamenensis]SDH72718.1 beta-glucosidase [Vibrio xiamenensis]
MNTKHNFTHRKYNILIIISFITIIIGCNDSDDDRTTLTGDDYYQNIAEGYLSNMTLTEKIDVVSGSDIGSDADPINLKNTAWGAVGTINGVINDDLDLPAVKLSDGPAGVKSAPYLVDEDLSDSYATAFPIGSLLASTWNTELVEELAQKLGAEAKELGTDFLLTPGMNIQRNPLAGRNFEYFSEDPIVSGKMAAAIVNGVQSQGVGATLKHFFGNESESNRLYVDVVATPRSLREIYLKGFRIAIDESEPWSIMSSYNKVNGSYVGHRKDAMTDILRNEWGFKGFAMTDWGADDVANDTDSPAKLMKAGNDLVMAGGDAIKEDLQASVESGDLDESIIDQNVVRILTQAQKTPSYSNYDYSGVPDSETSIDVARRAGTEGMVLVKNDSALPIDGDSQTVAMFGVAQYATYKGGLGSGNVLAKYTIDIATGLSERFTVNEDLMSWYQTYFDANKIAHYDSWGPLAYYEIDEASVTDNSDLETLLTESAESNDVAVIAISRQAGEGADRTETEGDYYLSADELEMITQVSSAFHEQSKKVVVVVNNNGVIDTSQWSDLVDGILIAYMGGQEMGYEVADLLSGDVNPSGKLAQTYPANYTDVPNADSFPGVDEDGDGDVDKIYYNEGIYVGYRYYTSKDVDVAYPFGYGLSYTTFTIDKASISNNTLSDGYSGQLTLSATVTNTGGISGKEVAQVYVTAPEVKLKKPTIELKAFAKTSELNPGGSETLTFDISSFELASFDPNGDEWIIEPGTYKVYISNSSDISDTTPISFSVSQEIVVAETTPGALSTTDNSIVDVDVE